MSDQLRILHQDSLCHKSWAHRVETLLGDFIEIAGQVGRGTLQRGIWAT